MFVMNSPRFQRGGQAAGSVLIGLYIRKRLRAQKTTGTMPNAGILPVTETTVSKSRATRRGGVTTHKSTLLTVMAAAYRVIGSRSVKVQHLLHVGMRFIAFEAFATVIWRIAQQFEGMGPCDGHGRKQERLSRRSLQPSRIPARNRRS